MSRTSLSKALVVLALVLPSVALMPAPFAPQAVRAKEVHGALTGDWRGTLRYRDYQDSSRFVSLPTLLTGTTTVDSASVRLAFTYDDGPGKTVRSTDQFAFDEAMRMLTWGPADGKRAPSAFSVESVRRDSALTLVVETDGEDDNRPARLRETITVGRGSLRVLKEVRFGTSAPWLYRHEYRFSRVR